MFSNENYKKKRMKKNERKCCFSVFVSGCLVDSTFYPEGHKLPADQTSNPCEICFCIGGSKRCAPKKCAPIIKNCRPIIPDGQCCPSSYDCSNYRFHFS